MHLILEGPFALKISQKVHKICVGAKNGEMALYAVIGFGSPRRDSAPRSDIAIVQNLALELCLI
jgi:hypothetical protein